MSIASVIAQIQSFLVFTLIITITGNEIKNESKYPIVVSTWAFVDAAKAAWRVADAGFSAVDAVVQVGPGGSPDENGETTLDALVMNGATMEVGAVAAMRYVKDGIKAARLVMDYTEHTLLVGEQASVFAISMGLPGPMNLSSEDSLQKWIKWKENNCQPNFRKNLFPSNSCGPYHPEENGYFDETSSSYLNLLETTIPKLSQISIHNHDTISMAVIDKMGHVAVGTSTNGATFKIPGRVGDGPIAGSSAYADDEVGACGATGDGDIMMRFLPCYQAVESMRQGMEPKLAAEDAISRISRKFPNFVGAIFAVNKDGVHAGACHGWTFQYSVRLPHMDDVKVFTITPQTTSSRVK
ncbi:putative isoaspartyl peptidase/L-asparaginase 3 isoform X1 [Silene latifolia]|uniref:putative isoaspartyl peptidase/L-asparaginase 3 isoform X1 n=1 Tax=Silene latifolia TaxID=37657 RepID=UPI003D7897D0